MTIETTNTYLNEEVEMTEFLIEIHRVGYSICTVLELPENSTEDEVIEAGWNKLEELNAPINREIDEIEWDIL